MYLSSIEDIDSIDVINSIDDIDAIDVVYSSILI